MFPRLDLLRKPPPIEQTAGAAIIDSMPHAVLALDQNNRVSYLNPAAEKLFNVKIAASQPLEEISTPLAEALQEARDAGESNIEYKDEDHGLAHYFEAHVSVLVDHRGRRTGWVVMVSDITEQKTLSMAQARSERFQILFDKSPDAVVLIDPHAPDVSWPIIDCNPTFCRMNGYDRKELIGQSIDIVHEGPDSGSNRADFFRRLRQEGTIKGTILHRRKDGSIYHIQYVTSLFTFEGKDFVLGIDRDITERIQVEQALIQHVSQLELINQVSREIAAELSPGILLAKAAELIQESFGYPHVGLFLLDQEHEELVMKARAGSYAALFPADHRLKLDAGINGWVARNGQRLLIGDVRTEPRYYNPFPEQLILSELSVPIKWGDETVGVLDIQSDQLDAFGKNDVLVLETLADQIATAIQNARLFEQTQQALGELAEAEGAIRAERDRAQQYLDVAGAIIVALDRDQRVTLINRQGCEVLGYEPHEIIGQDWFDFAIPKHEQQPTKAIFQQLTTGHIERLERAENVVITRQGEERIVEWRNALLRDEGGRITGTLSSGIDVTERCRAEADEHEQRILAEVLRDNAAIINSTLDLDSVLERVLENVVRVVDYSAADVLLIQDGVARIRRAKGYDQYVTEEVIQEIVLPVSTTANLRRMSETQQPDIIPDVSRDPDWIFSSTYAWARGYIGAPIIFNDEIIGFISLISKQPDVYQLSDAERLQAFADQATIAIRNAQLYEQVNRNAAELKASNERLAAYGHTIAHDLKNPLNTLLMAFEIILIENEGLSPAAQKFTRQSQKLVITMSRTIDGLLRFAELREDQAEIEPVDMNTVVEDVLAQLMKLIMDRGVRIEIAPDLPSAMGYTPWIQEVLANLISNAVKYIGQDNPDPLIMIRGSMQGDKVRYEIEDNGVGIAPEVQEKLFEMYTRFHKSEASGHGLGLPIVESIIHKLNGELGVESIPDEGSTFWFTLPAPLT